MKANLTSLRMVPICMAVLMLGACASRTVERQVVHEQPIIQQAPAQPAERVVVMPPPAPREEIPPAPSATGYTWIAGQYVWRDGWNWERGHWVVGSVRAMPSPYSEAPTQVPAANARWVPGYWEYVGNDWEWKKGHWEYR
jgi:hypothetical protein